MNNQSNENDAIAFVNCASVIFEEFLVSVFDGSAYPMLQSMFGISEEADLCRRDNPDNPSQRGCACCLFRSVMVS